MTTRFGPVLALWTLAVASAQVLPKPEPPFQGKVDINPANSTPDWPKPLIAPKGASNIVLILWDDTGFSATSTFGGHTYAGAGPASCRWSALQPLPRDSDVLPHEGGSAFGPQQSPGRIRQDLRIGGWLSGL